MKYLRVHSNEGFGERTLRKQGIWEFPFYMTLFGLLKMGFISLKRA